MNIDLSEDLRWLFGRRSVRAYRPGEVTEAQVRTLLEAAMAAPSAVAKDPWRFVVVRDRSTLKRLAEPLANGTMLIQASLAIVVAGDLEVAHDRQISYLLQDCAAATENLLIAAHMIGLGTCWLGVHPRENRVAALRLILNLPDTVVPVSCVAVGHPAELKGPRSRYTDTYVHHDRW